MADRIYDLTNDANPLDSASFVFDDATYPEARSITFAQLEAAIQADVISDSAAIIDGAGLEADGSLLADSTSTYITNADFLAAGYDVNLRNAVRLLDTAISTTVNNGTLTVQFNLTAPEVLALGTEILKIPALVGAGNYFHVTDVEARLDYNTTQYMSAGSKGIYIIFSGASDYIAELDKNFLEKSSGCTVSFKPVRHNMPANVGIAVKAPDGNPINGDSNIYVKLHYHIETEMTAGGAGGLGGNCCVSPLEGSFDNTDLTALGNLVITHDQVTQSLVCVIIDNTGAQVATLPTAGDEAGADPYNKITVPIGLGIAGTWKYFIIASK